MVRLVAANHPNSHTLIVLATYNVENYRTEQYDADVGSSSNAESDYHYYRSNDLECEYTQGGLFRQCNRGYASEPLLRSSQLDDYFHLIHDCIWAQRRCSCAIRDKPLKYVIFLPRRFGRFSVPSTTYSKRLQEFDSDERRGHDQASRPLRQFLVRSSCGPGVSDDTP